jgi:hypothetical protein
MGYSIDGSDYTNTTGIFTTVAMGSYTVTAKSAAGCVSAGTGVTITAQPATPTAPTASATLQPTCTVSTGTISVTAPTGTGMAYSIDGSDYTNTTGIFTTVATGSYTVTAKSAAGCVSAGTGVTINAQPATPSAPTAAATLQPTCTVSTGTISVTAPTGTGMGYSIDGSDYTNTTGIFTTVAMGSYTVTARSAAGCVSAGTGVTINAQPSTPSAPTASATLQPTCTVATGTISVTAPTGTGMAYSIDGSDYTNTTGVFTTVATGSYTVTAKSAAGCVSAGTGVTITAPQLIPTVTTLETTYNSSTKAISGGDASSDGGALITEKGICWSTSANPGIELSTKTNDGTGLGSYTSTLTGLSYGDTYYIRAYVTNCVGTSYGSEIQYVHISVGIDAIQVTDISVFPNPVNGILNIEYRNDNYVFMNILNSVGGLLETEKVISAGQKFDFSKYKSGFYILEFVKASGETKRIRVVNYE